VATRKTKQAATPKATYQSNFQAPLAQQIGAKGAEHATLVINLAELGTVALTAGITAEINHTRQASNVWTWRVVELGTSGLVMAYNGTRNTLGRIGLGVFAGALAETLVDSTPGLTGSAVPNPPRDALITWTPERR
jgi:hypothetical protein